MSRLLGVVVISLVIGFVLCHESMDNTTTSSSSTSHDNDQMHETEPPRKRNSKVRVPTISELLALIGGLFIVIALLLAMIAIFVYKLRGDRKIKKLKKQNDKEEARLDAAEKADREIPELMFISDAERVETLTRHEDELKEVHGSLNDQIARKCALDESTGKTMNTPEQVKNITATMKDRSSSSEMVKSIRDALAKADSSVSSSMLSTTPRSRRPDVKVRRETQIIVKVPYEYGDEGGAAETRPLNMNHLVDMVGYKVLIGQALGRDQSEEDMWRAIWDHEIGAVVWIGSKVESDQDYFKPYCPIKERGERQRIGIFSIVLVNLIEANGQKITIYEIEATNIISTETRQIRIVFVDKWLDWKAPTAATCILDTMNKIHDRLFKSNEATPCDTPLNNLLIQCPSGTNRSITFALIYLCRQSWLVAGNLNPIGVLMRLRQARYGAWSNLSDEEILGEMRSLYLVMEKVVDLCEFVKVERKKRASIPVVLPPWEIVRAQLKVANKQQEEPKWEKLC